MNLIRGNVEFSNQGKARIMLTGLGLGVVIGVGLCAALFVPSLRLLALFLAMQSVFHVLEFTFNAVFHPDELSANDFVLPWQHRLDSVCSSRQTQIFAVMLSCTRSSLRWQSISLSCSSFRA
jgi:hypothetical protein